MDKQLLKLNKKKKARGNFKEKAVLNNKHELDTVNLLFYTYFTTCIGHDIKLFPGV